MRSLVSFCASAMTVKERQARRGTKGTGCILDRAMATVRRSSIDRRKATGPTQRGRMAAKTRNERCEGKGWERREAQEIDLPICDSIIVDACHGGCSVQNGRRCCATTLPT